MAHITEIVFDSVNATRLARFWAAALDGYALRAYDDAEKSRLAALGFTPATNPNVAVDGPGPTRFFQQTPKVRRDGKRGDAVHLDVGAEDPPVERARLEALGASLLETRDDHLVLADPEGKRFCLFLRADRASLS